MKKTFYSFMAFAAVAMTVASCSSDIENNNNPVAGGKVAMTFSATQETSCASSRTALAEGNKVNWVSGDAITVWDGTAKNAFTVSPKSDATTADISGSVTSGSTSFTAVYPNSVGQSCTYSDGSITGLVIPATQTATAGSYDPAAAIMVATTTSNNLAFKNVCAFLKIKAAAAYSKIVVSTTSGNIAGTFSVDPSTGVATATTGANEITLSGTIASGSDYYIAIAPCSNVAGLTVKCYTSETEYVERVAASGKTPTFARGGVYNMGETTTANGWNAPAPTYAYVDLGLSVEWATCNVGASSPEEYGDYFAWGATIPYYTEGHSQDNPCSNWTEGKSGGYNWTNTPFNGGDSNFNETAWNNAKSSAVDSNNNLLPANDAASVNMGGTWRMPTQTEWSELNNSSYTNWVWTTSYNGKTVSGYIVYKKKSSGTYNVASDAHIFLPAAGYRNDGSLDDAGSYGNYWSSSLYTSNASYAYYMDFNSGNRSAYNDCRCYGFPVRAVRPKNP